MRPKVGITGRKKGPVDPGDDAVRADCQKGDVNLADLGDHQLQQLDISIQVLAVVRVVSVFMAMVAIQVHMHRKWRLLPIKTKMPMGAQQVA